MIDKSNLPQVFLSYAKEDIGIVRRLYDDLILRKVNVWWDKENLNPGGWKLQISRAITRSRYFVICLSSNAISKLNNQLGFQDKELQEAWEIAKIQDENNFTIIPVRIDDCDRGDN